MYSNGASIETMCFYPDPDHKWDGNSLDSKPQAYKVLHLVVYLSQMYGGPVHRKRTLWLDQLWGAAKTVASVIVANTH